MLLLSVWQLKCSNDGFSVVADYFGRGVFNKLTLITDLPSGKTATTIEAGLQRELLIHTKRSTWLQALSTRPLVLYGVPRCVLGPCIWLPPLAPNKAAWPGSAAARPSLTGPAGRRSGSAGRGAGPLGGRGRGCSRGRAAGEAAGHVGGRGYAAPRAGGHGGTGGGRRGPGASGVWRGGRRSGRRPVAAAGRERRGWQSDPRGHPPEPGRQRQDCGAGSALRPRTLRAAQVLRASRGWEAASASWVRAFPLLLWNSEKLGKPFLRNPGTVSSVIAAMVKEPGATTRVSLGSDWDQLAKSAQLL